MMVSQPVLSRTLRDLERALRTRLLDRTTRSVRPTADGRELLAVAEAVLESYQAGCGALPPTGTASAGS
jgi:DNA-binding transcriptional LysR family regulator